MDAGAHQPPLVQHQNQVGVQDGAHPLGHDELGGAHHLLPQGAAEGGVGLHVQGGKAVVKEEHPGILHQRPGDGQPLPLTAGEVGAPLGHRGIQP